MFSQPKFGKHIEVFVLLNKKEINFLEPYDIYSYI